MFTRSKGIERFGEVLGECGGQELEER